MVRGSLKVENQHVVLESFHSYKFVREIATELSFSKAIMGEDASSGETYPIPVQGILDFIETTRYQRPFEGVAYVRKNGEA